MILGLSNWKNNSVLLLWRIIWEIPDLRRVIVIKSYLSEMLCLRCLLDTEVRVSSSKLYIQVWKLGERLGLTINMSVYHNIHNI